VNGTNTADIQPARFSPDFAQRAHGAQFDVGEFCVRQKFAEKVFSVASLSAFGRVSRRDNEGSTQPGQLRFVQVGQIIEPQLKQIRRCPHSGCETQFIG
jgi:hypothetical protein